MIRLLAILAVVFLAGWTSIEFVARKAIYPFDPRQVAPADVGLPEVQEVRHGKGRKALVVWVADRAPGKPVIFYLHGNAGNLAVRAGRFRRFLDRGYGLIAPAYPGSSGSKGKPSEATLQTAMSSVWLGRDDLLPLHTAKADTDGPKVILYGESLGTAVAIALVSGAATGANAPDAVLLEAPFTSLKDIGLRLYPELDSLADQLPDLWPSLSRAPDLRVPLLIIHGTQDTLIPIDQGRQIFAAASTRDKDFFAVAGAGHNDLWRNDTLPRLWRFIESYGAGHR